MHSTHFKKSRNGSSLSPSSSSSEKFKKDRAAMSNQLYFSPKTDLRHKAERQKRNKHNKRDKLSPVAHKTAAVTHSSHFPSHQQQQQHSAKNSQSHRARHSNSSNPTSEKRLHLPSIGGGDSHAHNLTYTQDHQWKSQTKTLLPNSDTHNKASQMERNRKELNWRNLPDPNSSLKKTFSFLGVSGQTAAATDRKEFFGPAAYAQLKRVCTQNDRKMLDTLVSHRIDPNLSNKVGSTVLMDMSWNGNLPMCSALLKHHADVNKANLRGNTALHFAYERSHDNLIRLLELAGANPNLKNNTGNTPGDVQRMKRLQVHGTTELVEAINKCRPDTVKVLIEQGVSASSCDMSGHTVVMRAVLANQKAAEMVQILCEGKADLDMQDKTSLNTALHVAYEVRNDPIIEVLLAAGAKTWLKNRSGYSPQEWGQHLQVQTMGDLPTRLLHMCAGGDRGELMAFIHETGPDSIQGYDQAGKTPLILSVQKANADMVAGLLEVKAAVNQTELKGARNTPLHVAYDKNDEHIVQLLLSAKADTNMRNNKGFTPEEVKIYAAAIKIQAAAKGRLERESTKTFGPQRGAAKRSAENIYSDQLELAVARGSISDVSSLVHARANLDARNASGRTVLMVATQNSSPEMVKYLVSELRANPNVQDIRGCTALHIAYEMDDEACVTALEENGADVYIRNNIGFTGRGIKLRKLKAKKANSGSTPRMDPKAAKKPKWVNGIKQMLTKPLDRKDNMRLDKRLARLVAEGDANEARHFIEQSSDELNINAISKRTGDTALITAAKLDNTEMCAMLVDMDADPNWQNNRGNTVLHVAHSQQNTDLIEFLEELDVMKCSLRNDTGYTAQSLGQRLQKLKKMKEQEKQIEKRYEYPQELSDLIDAAAESADSTAVRAWLDGLRGPTTVAEGEDQGGGEGDSTLSKILRARNTAGDTVLTAAVTRNQFDVIQMLVSANADMNIQNRRGNSAMHAAYASGQPHVIMYFLSQGGDLSLKNNVGYTPEVLLERVTKQRARKERRAAAAGKLKIETSREKHHNELLRIVHDTNVSGERVSAWIATVQQELRALGKDEVDVEDEMYIIVNTLNKVNETVLYHLARECGNTNSDDERGVINAFTALLPFGDVGVINLRGDTLLHTAYEVEDDALRQLLLDAGADPTVTNNNGFTAADAGRRVAKRRQTQAMMQVPDNLVKSANDFSKPLHQAVRSNDLDGARQLLVEGANVNAQNANGSTVLMDAVWNGNLPMVELLCNSNADPNISNLRRNTALHFAYEKEHTDIAIYIEAHSDMRPTVNGLGRMVAGGKSKPMNEAAVALQRSMEAHSHAQTGTKFSKILMDLADHGDPGALAAFIAAVKKEAQEKFPKSPVEQEDYMSDILDAPDPRTQSTVLIVAVRARNLEAAELLLKNGADPNLQNNRGDTALHFAMRAADSELSDLLLKYQADGDIRNRMGMTPFAVKSRIQRKRNKVRSVESQFDDKLADMIADNDVDGVKERLAELQAQVQAKDPSEVPGTLQAQNNVGLTLLMIATYKDNHDIMQLLIDAKSDLEIRDRRGESALHIANEMLAPTAIQLLTAAGADKQCKNRVGLTPPEVGRKAARVAAKKAEHALASGEFSNELSAACSDGELEAVVDLLNAKADVNAQNKNGSTVLMDAAWNGHAQVVMQLVAKKADPDVQNKRKNTALHFAYMCEHVDVIEFLESLELATEGTKAVKQPKTKSKKNLAKTPTNNDQNYVSPVVKIQAQYRGNQARKADVAPVNLENSTMADQELTNL